MTATDAGSTVSSSFSCVTTLSSTVGQSGDATVALPKDFVSNCPTRGRGLCSHDGRTYSYRPYTSATAFTVTMPPTRNEDKHTVREESVELCAVTQLGTLCNQISAIWRRGSVVRTSVFVWQNFPDLHLIYGWHVTTSWVRCALRINQPCQLSLPSLPGRRMSINPCNYIDNGGGDH